MKVQDKRREEIVNNREEDVLALATAIANLSTATRRARTSLWSSLQATVLREMDPDLEVMKKEPTETKETSKTIPEKTESAADPVIDSL